MEGQIQAYTIQTHGVKLARKHLYDWIILVILAGIDVGLNRIDPYYRFVGKGMMTDLRYPLKPNTVPFWTVPIYTIALPVIIFFIRYLKRKDVHDLHHAVLGNLYAVFITAVITDAIKDGVGRPRPDFFWRCFPDGKGHYDPLGDVKCTGVHSIINEGHKSFPSGHTSLSFAGLGFLSLYLAAKIQAFDRRGHICKLCVVFLPILAAALVGVSRVDDYWHHWTDVFAGGLLGLTISFFCYHQFFPPPYHTKGWATYSYFKALEGEPITNGEIEVMIVEDVRSPNMAVVDSREDQNITIN